MSDSESSEAVKAAQEPEVLGSGETEEPLSASNAPSDGAADASAEGGDGTSEAVSAQAGDAPADGSDAVVAPIVPELIVRDSSGAVSPI